MCFAKWFKKKEKKPVERIVSKYTYGDHVRFRHKGEISPGIIYGISKDSEGEVIYQIQIGGECPAIIPGIKEKEVIPFKKPQY
jgi:hypothetical protein